MKFALQVYAISGNAGGPWPEGTLPLMSDNEDRLLAKINKMSGG